MRNRRTMVLLLVCTALFALSLSAHGLVTPCMAGPQPDALSRAASQYLSSLDPQRLSPPRARSLIVFYAPCGFRLAWSVNGVTTPQARAVMVAMGQADRKGLRAEDYGSSWWGCRASATEIPCAERGQELAQFDVDLTVAVTRFLSDLRYGRARPHSTKAGYSDLPDEEFLAGFIRQMLISTEDVSAALYELEPHYPGYLRTEGALSDMLTISHSEPDVVVATEAQHVAKGADGSVALALNQRLAQLGFLPRYLSPAAQTTFDASTEGAISRFQEFHGLAINGHLDPVTWRELNVPMQQRARQLAMTLERWRWVPQQFSRPPVVVNIPEFRLRAYDSDGKVQLAMAVIVGRAGSRKTPMLSASMTEVIFHPYWNVPQGIQRRELAPLANRNPSYLMQHDFQVVDRNGQTLDSRSEATHRLIAAGLVRVRQRPGSQNALGYLKFNFPNAFDVYMHGTPQTALFAQTKRDFSHGCIRVEDPNRLAAWVLQDQPGWSTDRIAKAIADPVTATVSLAAPVPVLIVYGTGIAAEDGTLRFFEDLYGYDAELSKTLDELSRTRHKEDNIPWSLVSPNATPFHEAADR